MSTADILILCKSSLFEPVFPDIWTGSTQKKRQDGASKEEFSVKSL